MVKPKSRPLGRPRLPEAAFRRPSSRTLQRESRGEEEYNGCQPSPGRCLFVVQQAQIAGGLLPLALVDSVLAEQLPQLLAQQQADGTFWSTSGSAASLLALLRSGAAFALLPALGARLLRKEGSSSVPLQPLRKLVWAGFAAALSGQLLVVFASGHEAYMKLLVVGVALCSTASASTTLALRLCCAEIAGSSGSRLCLALVVAGLIQHLGASLGQLCTWSNWGRQGFFLDFASSACGSTEPCFDLRVNLMLSLGLTVLGTCLGVRTAKGMEKKRWRLPNKASADCEAVQSTIPAEGAAQAALEEPGLRATLLASFLSWAAWHSWRLRRGRLLREELFQGQVGEDWMRCAEVIQFFAALFTAWALPRTLRYLGGFGTWLIGSLLLAALLLLFATVRNFGYEARVLWIVSFGFVPVLLLTVPYAIVIGRARARQSSVAVAAALASAMEPAAELSWAFVGEAPLRHLFGGSLAGFFAAGAACACWAAVVCSHAVVCDRDGAARCTATPRRKRFDSGL